MFFLLSPLKDILYGTIDSISFLRSFLMQFKIVQSNHYKIIETWSNLMGEKIQQIEFLTDISEKQVDR